MTSIFQRYRKPAENKALDKNLFRLFLFRQVVIFGELLAVAVFVFWVDLEIRLVWVAAIVGAMILLNIFTWFRYRHGGRATHHELFLQLLLDIAAFTGFLYLTGGASNPFSWFYLLPVMIAATLLPRNHTWLLALIAISCYSCLMVYYLPIQNSAGEAHQHLNHGGAFSQHIWGMWLGFVFSAVLVAYFVVGMASSLRQQAQDLAQAREQALQDERLVAMGTMAAGAAHDLGTPLGTMTIVTDELLHDYPHEDFPDLYSQLQLLSGQLKRCKEALSVISASAGEARAETGFAIEASEFIHDVVLNWHLGRPSVALSFMQGENTLSGKILSDRTVSQALINVLNNAADASPGCVNVEVDYDEYQLTILVKDEGNGLTSEGIEKAGKMPFTTKDQGMGVGLFLAHATFRRMGGRVTHDRRQRCGSCTRIILPLLETRR